MKKTIIIFGSLALLLVAGLTAVAWYILDSAEYAANKNKTAAAREKRWPKDKPMGEETPFEEVRTSSNGQQQEENQTT